MKLISPQDGQLNCSANIQGIQPLDLPPCNSSRQFGRLMDISKKLEQAAATTVYEMTGCLSACEKDDFEATLENWSESTQRSLSSYSEVGVIFTIYERSYIEEEQYIIYDSNSFLADVGGFLGLVLGSSMLNLFDEVVGLLGGLKIDMV